MRVRPWYAGHEGGLFPLLVLKNIYCAVYFVFVFEVIHGYNHCSEFE